MQVEGPLPLDRNSDVILEKNHSKYCCYLISDIFSLSVKILLSHSSNLSRKVKGYEKTKSLFSGLFVEVRINFAHFQRQSILNSPFHWCTINQHGAKRRRVYRSDA